MEKKIKAFILIEYFIYLAVILTIYLFALFKIEKIKERMKEREAVIKIVNIIDKYCSKSFKREEYKFIFKNKCKSIFVFKEGEENLVEKVELPKVLEYKIPYKGVYSNKFIFNSTINSNISKAFSIYILSNKKADYRITFYLFRKNKILKINIYRSLISKKLNEKEILDNYDNEEFLKERWVKINEY